MKYSIHMVGYSKIDPIGNFEDKVVVRLVDKDPEKAVQRAMKLIKRDNWLVAEIVEILPKTE